MNDTYIKYGLASALVLQALAMVAGFAGNALVALVVLGALGVAVANKFCKEKIVLCDAYVYKHLKNGELLYCDGIQATHKDYQYLGTAKVNCKDVNHCSLS